MLFDLNDMKNKIKADMITKLIQYLISSSLAIMKQKTSFFRMFGGA